MTPLLRQTSTALRALLVLTVVLGLGYPLVVLGLGQALLPHQANGSLVRVDGEVVGSSLLGQSFADADGNALGEWFQSRPSSSGYAGDASAASNYGPENPELIAFIETQRAAVAAFEDIDPADVPVDALTTSASSLDPHISPAYALLQVPRVAAERGLDEDDVRALVESRTQGRDLGYLGEPTVNVLGLNVALAQLDRGD
jgi:K+-transporting ATPase ATPase C chain